MLAHIWFRLYESWFGRILLFCFIAACTIAGIGATTGLFYASFVQLIALSCLATILLTVLVSLLIRWKLKNAEPIL